MNEIIMKEYYDDMLDEMFGTVEICGIEYSASIALYRVDEIAYVKHTKKTVLMLTYLEMRKNERMC